MHPDIDQTQLSEALSSAWQQAVTDALDDLQHPVSYQDQVAPLLPFANSLYTWGFAPEDPSFTDVIDGLLKFAGFPLSDVTLNSSPADIINDISSTLSYDYSFVAPRCRRNQCVPHQSPRLRRQRCHGSARGR